MRCSVFIFIDRELMILQTSSNIVPCKCHHVGCEIESNRERDHGFGVKPEASSPDSLHTHHSIFRYMVLRIAAVQNI